MPGITLTEYGYWTDTGLTQEGLRLFKKGQDGLKCHKETKFLGLDPYDYYNRCNINTDKDCPGRCWFRSQFPEIARIHRI